MVERERIYRDYHGKVLSYLCAKLNSPQDAEDLAADVFVKVCEKLDAFDESKASLSTWIYTVARNTLTDFYRTRRTFEQIPETQEDGSSVEAAVCSAETLEALADALEALEERERDIIILRFYSGKTLREIAAQLGISYAYVKVLQGRALEKLKKMLET